MSSLPVSEFEPSDDLAAIREGRIGVFYDTRRIAAIGRSFGASGVRGRDGCLALPTKVRVS